MTRIVAIKTFFQKDGGRKVGMDELKALDVDEKTELGKLCCAELGVEYTAKAGE